MRSLVKALVNSTVLPVLSKHQFIVYNVYGSRSKSMKAHTVGQPAAPRGVSFHLVALALVMLVLQPLLMGLHCGPGLAHSHFEGQSPYHAHEEVASHDTHHDAHHDERSDNHKALVDAHEPYHGHSEQSSPASHGLSAAPDHQHEACCSHGDAPFLRAALPARSGTNEALSLPTPQSAALVPVFKLHVLAGIHSRAGPPDVPLRTQFRCTSLLGRAPPLSA